MGEKKTMDLDDYDLNILFTGDGRLWYTRTFAFSLVYRYRSCLQGGTSPAESSVQIRTRKDEMNVNSE